MRRIDMLGLPPSTVCLPDIEDGNIRYKHVTEP
jgi:hypothetical protein